MVKNVLRKPVLIGPIGFDIVIVRDMSEKATENKVFYLKLPKAESEPTKIVCKQNPLKKNLRPQNKVEPSGCRTIHISHIINTRFLVSIYMAFVRCILLS